MAKTVSLVIPEEVKKGLDIIAKKEKRTFSALVRAILIKELENSDNEEVRELVKDL